MDVAITGATGHIGAGLTRAVLAQGRTARVIVRNDLRAVQGLKVERVTGDVMDTDSLDKLCKGVTTVFHAAAKLSLLGSEGGSIERINIIGTRNVIEACIRNGVKRLVHFSSIQAFCSHPSDEVIDESRKLAFDDEYSYDRSKAISQLEVLKANDRGLETVVLNPTAVIGPYDYKISRFGEVLLDLYNQRLPALINGGHDMVDVRDVIQCALAAEQMGKSGECYLVSGQWYHIKDFARIITDITGIKTPTFITPIWLCAIPAQMLAIIGKMSNGSPRLTPYALRTLQDHHYISHEKATRELGYNPRPLVETIRDTLDWFKQEEMLDMRP